MIACASALLAAGSACFAASAAGPDWPQWRGPDGSGYAAESAPPIEFSETKNIKWKVAIPGEGHSSPVVWGDSVYLTSAIKTGTLADAAARVRPRATGTHGPGAAPPDALYKFNALAIDRATGEIVWEKTLAEELPYEGVHSTSSFAAASPIVDGERVVAFFGTRGLFCLDLDGEVLWQKDFGHMETRNGWGEGATPALHGSTLVVPWDNELQSFVAAIDVRTGEELWRNLRDERTTWGTPAFALVNGRTQAILTGNDHCVAYDLETGGELWRTRGLNINAIPTPIVGDGVVYLMSGYQGSYLLAVKLAEAVGDITGTDAIAFTYNRNTPYVPSGMLAGDRLYFLGYMSGILTCLDARTGEPLYRGQRLGPVRNVYASIVGAGGYLYVCGRDGNIAIVEEGPEFKLVRVNTLESGINASPAIVGDEMYLRTSGRLYCIARTGG